MVFFWTFSFDPKEKYAVNKNPLTTPKSACIIVKLRQGKNLDMQKEFFP